MKKLIFILMTIIPVVGFSQSSIGVKGGIVVSNTNYSGYLEEKPLASSVFGLVYQHLFNRVMLSVEPGYTTKGFLLYYTYTDNDGNPIGNAKARYKFNYIEIPILVGYNIVDKDVYFGLNAGIAPNFLVSAKVKMPNFDNNNGGEKNIKLTGYNSVLLDVIGGAYLGYKFSDNLFGAINVRYGNGLTKIHPKNINDSRFSYVTSFVNLGYRF